MPEAIATTKRKFHRLLDTLTSYANAPAHSTEPATPLTAREKLEQASERVRKRQRQDGSLSSIESRFTQNGSSTSLPHKLSSKSSPRKHVDKTPNFSPWSQETFLQRLHTFNNVQLWHPKPIGIDELAWAKRGWRCVDVNTVACQVCGSRVLVNLNVQPRKIIDEDEPDDEEALEQALVTRYKEEIIAGHGVNCLWRQAGCKDDIYRLQVVRPAVWQPALKSRYKTLSSISDSIRDIKIRDTVDSATQMTIEQIHTELPTEILSSSDIAPDIQIRALKIAMHGWRGSSEPTLLNCDACFQRLGLWMYQPGYRPRGMDQDDDDVPSINLVEMHREYCPWRTAESQQASGTLAGLNASEILFKVVATYLKEKRRRQEDQATSLDVPELPDPFTDAPKLSRQEIEQQDRERESRLQKLKRMLTIKRPPKTVNKAR